MKRQYYPTAVAAFFASAIGRVYATQSGENVALAIGGKASRAEYERHNGPWVFDVEVVKDKKIMDVKVDSTSGKVIAATEDKTNYDDAHDRAG